MLLDYQIVYRNEQGVLPRIIAALTQRSIDIETIFGTSRLDRQPEHFCHLVFEASEKQEEQLKRQWNAIIGVIDVKKR
jgi:acetolactate synthase small subunit